MQIQELVDEIHALAKEKEWYDCPVCTGKGEIGWDEYNDHTWNACPLCDGTGHYRNEAMCIALIHTEVTEFEVTIDSAQDWEELADIAIRSMDTIGWLMRHHPDATLPPPPEDYMKEGQKRMYAGKRTMNLIRHMLDAATEHLRCGRTMHATSQLMGVVNICFACYDGLEATIREKHERNKQRPAKHGKLF